MCSPHFVLNKTEGNTTTGMLSTSHNLVVFTAASNVNVCLLLCCSGATLDNWRRAGVRGGGRAAGIYCLNKRSADWTVLCKPKIVRILARAPIAMMHKHHPLAMQTQKMRVFSPLQAGLVKYPHISYQPSFEIKGRP